MNEILYQDKFCKLKNDKITIETYYFPTGIAKEIEYKDVTKVSLHSGFMVRVFLF
jgi:hypothetical protein